MAHKLESWRKTNNNICGNLERMAEISAEGIFKKRELEAMKDAVHHIYRMTENCLYHQMCKDDGDPEGIAKYLEVELKQYKPRSKELKLIKEYICLAREIREFCKNEVKDRLKQNK